MKEYLRENLLIKKELASAPNKAPTGIKPFRRPSVNPGGRSI
jgi:hypothetical protein